MKTLNRIICIFNFLLIINQSHGQSIPRFTVKPLQDYDSLFERSSGWTGADGVFTVLMDATKTLWLFSDTWIGKIQNGKHIDSTLINNSIALQSGTDPQNATIEFFYKTKPDGKPAALIEPLDGQGWFWLFHGVMTTNGLYLFLMQTLRIDDSAFGFKHAAAWLGHVTNPNEKPTNWNLSQKKIPWDRASQNGDLYFGSAVLKAENTLYIYGADEEKREGWLHRYLILSRVEEDRIADFSAWRFYSKGNWTEDYKQAERLCESIGSEFSIHYQAGLKKYVLLTSENGLSENVQIRLSDKPWGPWSDAVTVYQCPEQKWHPSYFCYAAKGHPELSKSPNELIFTYVCNSSDFWKMAADARIYRPRFVKILFALGK